MVRLFKVYPATLFPIALPVLAISPDLRHLPGFGRLQQHLNYMAAVLASLPKLNKEDQGKFVILFLSKGP